MSLPTSSLLLLYPTTPPTNGSELAGAFVAPMLKGVPDDAGGVKETWSASDTSDTICISPYVLYARAMSP
jgi:hypothetical protein